MSKQPYEVGYGKPPVETRFKKGRSGNPRGRHKGNVNLVTAIKAALNERVVVKENGRVRTISKIEATLIQVANKAAGGDLNAARFLVDLSRQVELYEEAKTSPGDAPLEDRLAADQALLKSLRERLQGMAESETSDA
jgi:hypothetical protein